MRAGKPEGSLARWWLASWPISTIGSCMAFMKKGVSVSSSRVAQGIQVLFAPGRVGVRQEFAQDPAFGGGEQAQEGVHGPLAPGARAQDGGERRERPFRAERARIHGERQRLGDLVALLRQVAEAGLSGRGGLGDHGRIAGHLAFGHQAEGVQQERFEAPRAEARRASSAGAALPPSWPAACCSPATASGALGWNRAAAWRSSSGRVEARGRVCRRLSRSRSVLVVQEVQAGAFGQVEQVVQGRRMRQGAQDPQGQALGERVAVPVGGDEGLDVAFPGHGGKQLGALGGQARVALAFHEPAHVVGERLLGLELAQFPGQDHLVVGSARCCWSAWSASRASRVPMAPRAAQPSSNTPRSGSTWSPLASQGTHSGQSKPGDAGEDGLAQAARRGAGREAARPGPAAPASSASAASGPGGPGNAASPSAYSPSRTRRASRGVRGALRGRAGHVIYCYRPGERICAQVQLFFFSAGRALRPGCSGCRPP